MERREGYEQYGKEAMKNFKTGAEIAFIPVKKVYEAEKPLLKLVFDLKMAEAYRKFDAFQKRYNMGRYGKSRTRRLERTFAKPR